MSNQTRTISISSARRIAAKNKYELIIAIPTDIRKDDYKYIALKYASIPNSFYVVQEGVNDQMTYVFQIAIRSVSEGKQEIEHIEFNYNMTIPQGDYSGDELLKMFNSPFDKLTQGEVMDVIKTVHPEVESTSTNANLLMFDPSTAFDKKQCTSTDPHHIHTTNLTFKGASKIVGLKCHDVAGHEYTGAFICSIKLRSPGISYRFLGMGDSEYVLVNHEHDASGSLTYKFPEITLPGEPTIIWVDSVSIRMDMVNQDQDSKILETFPIVDFTQPYIAFNNNDLISRAKKLGNYTEGQVIVSITQQDGFQLDLKMHDYNFEVALF